MTKYYFINKFDTNLINQQDKKTIFIYRNYLNFNLEEILKLKRFCKIKRYKLFLANNIKLSLKLNLNGVYISAHNKKLYKGLKTMAIKLTPQILDNLIEMALIWGLRISFSY